MAGKQERPAASGLANKPSVAFSTTSSAASATSAATSRSGGHKLLFGEVDTSSSRPSNSFASVCSFVLCDSSTFLKFWLEDTCRETFLSYIPHEDLPSLRLTCHDFGVRAAPALFKDITIDFRANTFTRPGRTAALDRMGFHVRSLKFSLPHSPATFLPPLVDPSTGGELSFTYTPLAEKPTPNRRPKYGDLATTELLTRQWPALFHAATNVPAFIDAFSSFINLNHLTISCPGYDATQTYRRSIVDYALISLRIAVERNNLNVLQSLTISPIHLSGLQYLLPSFGVGATPRSFRRWSRIKHLTLHVDSAGFPPRQQAGIEGSEPPDHFKILQLYLRNFQSNLLTLSFRWDGEKGVFPLRRPSRPPVAPPPHAAEHPSTRPPQLRFVKTIPPPVASRKRNPPLIFPNLKRAKFANITARAKDIRAFARASFQQHSIRDLDFEGVELVEGTWDEALSPFDHDLRRAEKPVSTKADAAAEEEEMAEIPIMLARTPVPRAEAPAKTPTLSPEAPVKLAATPTIKTPTMSAETPILLAPTTYQRPRAKAKVERVDVERVEMLVDESVSLRLSRLLAMSKPERSSTTARKVREGLMDVFKGGGLPWR